MRYCGAAPSDNFPCRFPVCPTHTNTHTRARATRATHAPTATSQTRLLHLASTTYTTTCGWRRRPKTSIRDIRGCGFTVVPFPFRTGSCPSIPHAPRLAGHAGLTFERPSRAEYGQQRPALWQCRRGGEILKGLCSAFYWSTGIGGPGRQPGVGRGGRAGGRPDGRPGIVSRKLQATVLSLHRAASPLRH